MRLGIRIISVSFYFTYLIFPQSVFSQGQNNQIELIEHPPVRLDVKDGVLVLPSAEVYKPKQEYEYGENGKVAGVILKDKSRIQIVYDQESRVCKIIGPGIKKTIVSYPDEDTRIVEQGMIKKIYEYRENGRLLKITDSLGNSTIKEFDADGDLVGFTDSAGAKNIFSYDGNGNLVSFANGLGQKTMFGYDANNRPVSITTPSGVSFKRSYDENGNIAGIIDPAGNKTAFLYDSAGRIISVTNARGYVARIEYDAMGNPTKYINPAGESIVREYDLLDKIIKEVLPGGSATVYRYDENDNLAEITESGGGKTIMQYDEMGNLTKIIINGIIRNVYSYDIYGRLMEEKDSAENILSYKYDENDNLIEVVYPNGAVYKYGYDANNNNISLIGPQGEVTRYEYTPNGFLAKIVYLNGLEESFSYDASGQIVAKTDIRGNKTNYEYDLDGNLISKKDLSGITTRYLFDKYSRLIKVSYPEGKELSYQYDECGSIITMTDEKGLATKYLYDPLNKINKIIDPKGNTTEYSYDQDGNIAKILDPLGNITEYKFIDNKLSELRDPYSGNFNYKYDSFGRLISIANKLGDIITQEYDALGRVIRTRDILGHTEKHNYDNMGNVTSIVDYNGNSHKYAYDLNNRLVEVIDPLGNIFKINYDTNQNTRSVIGTKGELLFKEKIDPYEVKPDVSNEANVPNLKVKIKYEYDNYHRLTRLIYPSGKAVTYQYNNLGRLTEIAVGDNEKFLLSYDISGRLISIRYPNGLQALYEYDPLGRIIKAENTKSDGEVVSGFLYNYDASGNKISSKNHKGDETKYSYDANNQLISHLPPLQSKCDYDLNGNVSVIGDIKFNYDEMNRLKEVKLADGKIITYGYSPDGNRIWKDSGSGKVYFIYDRGNIITEIEGEKIIAEYVYGPYVDQPLQVVIGNKTYYYHSDGIGTITALSDTGQNINAAYEYDPWGNLINSAGNIKNPYLFTGREYEPESDIYYYRTRYYSPRLGQFLTKDTYPVDLMDPLTLNQYMYCRNNPLTITDPFGLKGGTVYFTDPLTGAERPMNIGLGGRPAEYNLGVDANGVPQYFSQGAMRPNADTIIHPTKGYVPMTSGNINDIQRLRAQGVPEMTAEQANNLWIKQNPRLAQKARSARTFDEAVNPNLYRGPNKLKDTPNPNSPHYPFTAPTPGEKRSPSMGSSGASNRAYQRSQARPARGNTGYGTTVPTGRPNMMRPVGGNPTGIGLASDPSQAIAGILQSIGRAGTDYVDQETIRREIEKFLGNYPAGHEVDVTAFILRTSADQETGNTPIVWGRNGPKIYIAGGKSPSIMVPSTDPFQYWTAQNLGKLRGTGPRQEDLLNRLRQMVDINNRIKGLLGNSDYWNRALGQTVAGPRGVSLSSQAASGQTASTDIGLAQQQAIDKVRSQRADLESVQNRIQDLMNQYNRNRGAVGNDWSQSWDRARQDWDGIIRDMSRPQPGWSGGSTGGSDHPHDAQGQDVPSGGSSGPGYIESMS